MDVDHVSRRARVPPEFANRQDDYVRHVCDDMLPAVAAEQLADAADVFCERIAFTREQTERVFERAQVSA